MAEEKAAEAAPKEEAPAGPKMIMGLPLPTFLFVAANLLATTGAFAFIVHASLLYRKPPITESQALSEVAKVEEKKTAEAGEELLAISYPEMTISLRGEQGGKPHYATVEATLVCGSPACKAQVEANKAKILDAIQTATSARSYTELSSLETKLRLKHDILGRVNSFLKETAATDLLFSSFLVL